MHNHSSGYIFSVISFIAIALWGIHIYTLPPKILRPEKLRKRIAFIEAYVFPQQIAKRLHEKYPHLSDEQVSQVMDTLKKFFTFFIRREIEIVSIPSQVVDEAWHEFILSTRQYEEFCQNAFGRFLHHTPAEAMKTPTDAQNGIRHAWQLACTQEGINMKSPEKLPQLFAIDTRLMIADGYSYVLNCTLPVDAGTAIYNKNTVYCAAHISRSGGGERERHIYLYIDEEDEDGGDGGDGGGGGGGGGGSGGG